MMETLLELNFPMFISKEIKISKLIKNEAKIKITKDFLFYDIHMAFYHKAILLENSDEQHDVKAVTKKRGIINLKDITALSEEHETENTLITEDSEVVLDTSYTHSLYVKLNNNDFMLTGPQEEIETIYNHLYNHLIKNNKK